MAKYGPQKRSVAKAFNSAVSMRSDIRRKALAYIHQKYSRSDASKEEVMFERMMHSNDSIVYSFVCEIEELNEIISKLSKWL